MFQQAEETIINHFVYDSRRVQQAASSVFIAIITEYNDGHRFLQQAYDRGIRNFIISSQQYRINTDDVNVVLVDDSLQCLQQLAAHHRSAFQLPVIGITGSNGKTIVKEWLNLMLEADHQIVRSPKSFNSQLGVPLSLLQITSEHNLALIEAGISRHGEMEKLEAMIHPNIGILTNIGEAHSHGFANRDQKLSDKLQLFLHSDVVIARGKDLIPVLENAGTANRSKFLLWGDESHNDFVVSPHNTEGAGTSFTIRFKNRESLFTIGFTDRASVENAIICCCTLLYLNYEGNAIQQRLHLLHTVEMRLELLHSFNECLIINDSYSADLTSLRISLDFLEQQDAGLQRTLILSEFLDSGRSDENLYRQIASLALQYRITRIIGVGEKIRDLLFPHLPPSIAAQFYPSTDDLIRELRTSSFHHEIILVKGARKFGFEKIVQVFERKQHQTVLEIDLNALGHNLKQYQKLLRPSTRIMAMVKAFSYGSGGAEIAGALEYHNVSYLGVAYADEGVELVKAGINLPVMVMNAEESSFRSIVENELEPVLYSFSIFHSVSHYLRAQGLYNYPVHLEIETGMNRLGFRIDELPALCEHLRQSNLLQIQSVFSHLAASEDPQQDDFTKEQATLFEKATQLLDDHIPYSYIRHLSNSAAIVRHPHLQYDMVRLGIGLYGIEIDHDDRLQLKAAASLLSTIAQLKWVKAGESVSYNRRGVVHRDSLIATVRIGYADGYSRRFGNGTGSMIVHGQIARVIGTVCMDMTMIDVTDIARVKVGDEVLIFGPALPVQQLADAIGTIPYEIMTGVSQRVKRVYYFE